MRRAELGAHPRCPRLLPAGSGWAALFTKGRFGACLMVADMHCSPSGSLPGCQAPDLRPSVTPCHAHCAKQALYRLRPDSRQHLTGMTDDMCRCAAAQVPWLCPVEVEAAGGQEAVGVAAVCCCLGCRSTDACPPTGAGALSLPCSTTWVPRGVANWRAPREPFVEESISLDD